MARPIHCCCAAPISLWTQAEAARLMSHPWQAVGFAVGIAHTNTFGDPVAYLAELDPAWVTHIHLSDNDPAHGHLPLGQGEIDIAAVLRALAATYRGIVSTEGYLPGRGDTLLQNNIAVLRAARGEASSPALREHPEPPPA